ncbi:MAG: EamA family transporter [Holosporales bacterium]|jgi:drug/metabolite transporter (DMT)-like permease|nr:EamA family transporter [Holosporales bacterium]
MEKLFLVCLLAFQITLNAGTQIILKSGVNSLSFDLAKRSLLQILFETITNWYVVIGVFCYALSFGIWLYLLSKLEVSYLYPMGSISYVIAAVAGHYLLKESLSPVRIAGILVIVIGVCLVAKS